MTFDRPHDFLLVLHCNNLSCTVSKILLISENLNMSNDRDLADLRDNSALQMCHMVSQCTKFKIFSFSHSSDILWGLKILMGHMTITAPLLGMMCNQFVKTRYSLPVYKI